MSHVPPDYDTDPERSRAWRSPSDVHESIAPELRGPVLDVACGDGRLASLLSQDVWWTGIDSSPSQLAANPHRPVTLGDMRRLPFQDGAFEEVTHLWCLYHLPDPAPAIAEARRVLKPGGRYYASTTARTNDPELMTEGYPPSSFDAEEAAGIVAAVFGNVSVERWDRPVVVLQTRAEVRAYCRSHHIPPVMAEDAVVPLWLTKRGALVRAIKHSSD